MTVSLSVTTKWGKTADVDLRRLLAQPMAIAQATASHIRRRLLAGRTATPARGYASRPTSGPRKHKSFYVSPAYADEIGQADQTKWRSSADFHRHVGATAGKGKVTGGLWRGLQVRNYGNKGAVIEFGGSSLGASSKRTAILKKRTGTFELDLSDSSKLRAKQAKAYARTEDGQVKYRRKPKLVRNALKASAVFKHTRIGLLQQTPGETVAQWAAYRDYSGLLVARSFGMTHRPGGAEGNTSLYNAITRGLLR